MAVALTSMLVMNTLFNAMEQRLPVDANLKMIDIWLMHGLYMPFFVFCIHIAAKLLKERQKKVQETTKLEGKNKLVEEQTRGPFMRVCSILIPTFSLVFVVTFTITAITVYTG